MKVLYSMLYCEAFIFTFLKAFFKKNTCQYIIDEHPRGSFMQHSNYEIEQTFSASPSICNFQISFFFRLTGIQRLTLTRNSKKLVARRKSQSRHTILRISLSPVKRRDMGLSLSVCPSVCPSPLSQGSLCTRVRYEGIKLEL